MDHVENKRPPLGLLYRGKTTLGAREKAEKRHHTIRFIPVHAEGYTITEDIVFSRLNLFIYKDRVVATSSDQNISEKWQKMSHKYLKPK